MYTTSNTISEMVIDSTHSNSNVEGRSLTIANVVKLAREKTRRKDSEAKIQYMMEDG